MAVISRSAQRVVRTAACGPAVAAAASRRPPVDAALAMLDAGGNAVDAAVACGFVAGVVEPAETCLAGSGFLLAWDAAQRRATSFEFPPRAPQRCRPDMYEPVSSAGATKLLGVTTVAGDANVEGILACAVPGTVAGLLAAHERLGRLPRAQVMEPALQAATEGFEADAYYALAALDNLEVLRRHESAAAIYLDEGGLPPTPAFLGDATLGVPPLIRQPDLARTLEIVAERGAPGFYAGEVAAAIESHFEAHGGLIDRDDLAAYEPIIAEPLRLGYRGHDVFAPTSPSGAWTELQILRVLERFDMTGSDALHAIAAASRHAFAHRYRWLGDGAEPLGHDPDVTAAAIRAGDNGPVADGKPWEVFAFDRHGTTHFVVVDGDGMTVSCTHTAGNAFGSKVVAEGTGLLFDAGMVWFNAHPGVVNSIAPGKRPLVNMGPLLVTRDGAPRLAVGAPGGRRIIDAVVQVVVNVLDRGMAVDEALAAPRIDASGSAVLASERLGPELAALRERGHPVTAVREEHVPYCYEFARPVAAEVAADGTRRAGVHPFSEGHAAAR
jgi:gamma-glutamyltranspeptidase / glutathione hydrolase